EDLLKEALPIRARAPGIVPSRRRTIADDDWSVATTKALVGATLVAQQRYAEAEAVLLEARRDLDLQPKPSARDVTATITGLAHLDEAWAKPEAAVAYRARLR